MKLQILSDLHLEFGACAVPDVEADLVILAGDTHTRTRGPDWARARFPDREIVYVPGNHEYYGSEVGAEDERLAAACEALDIRFLQMGVWEGPGLRVLGATLWTDLALFSDPSAAALVVGERMNDYHRIRVAPSYSRLRPVDTMGLHLRQRSWLQSTLARPFDGVTVVVSHHAPSIRSALRGTESDPLTAAYCSNLADLVAGSGAALWIHGHTHQPVDYLIGATRVLSNPRGYAHDEAVGFEPGLVVEV